MTTFNCLKLGERLLQRGGEIALVESIRRVAGRRRVFNFEVAGAHNYYVEDGALLVHNGKNCKKAKKLKRRKARNKRRKRRKAAPEKLDYQDFLPDYNKENTVDKLVYQRLVPAQRRRSFDASKIQAIAEDMHFNAIRPPSVLPIGTDPVKIHRGGKVGAGHHRIVAAAQSGRLGELQRHPDTVFKPATPRAKTLGTMHFQETETEEKLNWGKYGW